MLLGISPLTSFILASGANLVARLVILGVLSLIFLILVLTTFFLTISFLTALLSLLKSVVTGSTHQHLVFPNLSISNLSISDSKLVNSSF